MRSIIAKVARKILMWAEKRRGVIAVYVPEIVVEREATGCPDFVEEDSYLLYCACIEAWYDKNR